jgi:hypothetical protein
MVRSGGGEVSQLQHQQKKLQDAGEEEGEGKRSVDTLLGGVVSGLREWEGVGRRDGGGGV